MGACGWGGQKNSSNMSLLCLKHIHLQWGDGACRNGVPREPLHQARGMSDEQTTDPTAAECGLGVV